MPSIWILAAGIKKNVCLDNNKINVYGSQAAVTTILIPSSPMGPITNLELPNDLGRSRVAASGVRGPELSEEVEEEDSSPT